MKNNIIFKRVINIEQEEIKQLVNIDKDNFHEDGLTIMSIIPLIQYQYIFCGKIGKEVICSTQIIENVNNREEVFIFGFSVKKEFQKQSIGKSFIKFIEKEMKKYGFKKIKLYVDPNSAYKFYKKVGYKNIQQIDNLYSEGNHRIVMVKEL